MRKHRIDKIQEISGVSDNLCPPDTPEETAALIAELLLIAERMPGAITSESTKIISGAITSESTKINSPGVTEINSGDDTGTFSNDELLILEQIQNAEQ
jgi:hypothetical protein